jgi:hypothetical protein
MREASEVYSDQNNCWNSGGIERYKERENQKK